MKAVQGISQSYSHLGSDFFFRKFSKHWYVIYSGLESKNKQNTDNIKALQVTFLFPKFTLQPRALQVLSFIFCGFIKKTGLFR